MSGVKILGFVNPQSDAESNIHIFPEKEQLAYFLVSKSYVESIEDYKSDDFQDLKRITLSDDAVMDYIIPGSEKIRDKLMSGTIASQLMLNTALKSPEEPTILTPSSWYVTVYIGCW